MPFAERKATLLPLRLAALLPRRRSALARSAARGASRLLPSICSRPLASRPLLPCRAAEHAKVELAAVDIDVGDFHADHVSQPIAVAGAMAGEAVAGRLVVVVVVGQGVDANV